MSTQVRNAPCNAVTRVVTPDVTHGVGNAPCGWVQNQSQNQSSFGRLGLLSNQVQKAFTYARRLGIGAMQ